MSLEQLWAGWRSEYVVAASEQERQEANAADGGVRTGPESCVFCKILSSGAPSADNGIVWRDDTSAVLLNAYPYASGHMLVMPVRHLDDLAGLSAEESTSLWETARRAVAAITTAYDPDGVNLGANLGRAAGAGIPRHLHLHALPRWQADTNFMTTVASVRVIPEALTVTWQRLTDAWIS